MYEIVCSSLPEVAVLGTTIAVPAFKSIVISSEYVLPIDLYSSLKVIGRVIAL